MYDRTGEGTIRGLTRPSRSSRSMALSGWVGGIGEGESRLMEMKDGVIVVCV